MGDHDPWYEHEANCNDCAVDAAATGYFIAADAWNDLWVWRERGNYPVPVIAQTALLDDPEVWEVLAAAFPTVQT